MKNDAKTRRLFFALWPSDRVRQSILKQYSHLTGHDSGRVMLPRNLHVTLFFIGPTTGLTKDCMHHAAQTIKAESFLLNLDCYGHFNKARIFWMGSQSMPTELSRLHSALGTVIEGCGFRSEDRLYTPHLTLMRKCRNPRLSHDQADFSIPWQVEDFVLVESVPAVMSTGSAVNYQVIEKYPLA